jgi:hypothetical protein
MHPCKECLVRACCITQCKKYEKYKKEASEIAGSSSFIAASLLIIPTLIYFTEGFPHLLAYIWALNIIPLGILCVKYRMEEAGTILFGLFLGPIFTLSTIFLIISAKFIKRYEK